MTEVHLIGTRHVGEDYKKLEKALIEKASRKEIVLGLEGRIRDDSLEEAYFQDCFGLERGYIRGLEDPMSMAFCQAIASCLIFSDFVDDEFVEQRLKVSKAQIISNLRCIPQLREIYDRAEGKVIDLTTLRLSETIRNIVYRTFQLGMKDKQWAPAVIEVLKRSPELDSNETWLDLSKHFAREFLEFFRSYPQDFQPPFDRLQKYIDEPLKDDGVIMDVNGEWRNLFLYKNVKQVLDLAIATHSLDCYFLVGSAHVSGIETRLRKDYPDLVFSVASNQNGIPEEYKHLIEN